MSKLRIKIGEEYKIKIETGNEFDNSIFNELYEKAAININDIIDQADKRRKIDTAINYNTDFSFSADYNNIIAFTGERGTGKSSSMVSFAEALINKDKNIVGKYFDKYENIFKKDFLSIQMIDPSLFSKKDTLLEIIISKMFLKFQKNLDRNNNSDLNYDKKRELISEFQKVFENLKTLHGKKEQIYELESIETLSKLANGTNLKENIFKLIEIYLEYFNSKEGFLVIAIDDFDLNVEGAYIMLEDIRQYLIQSNIIILIACKVEQLQDSIKQSIVSSYKELINYEGTNKLSDTPESKSIKYLEKLFPISHRLETPKFNNLFSNIDKSRKNKFKVSDKDNNEIINSQSIETGLLKFIYNKNDFFISKSKNSLVSIFPNTLRELNNFIGFLNVNEEVKDLKNYFLKDIENNLEKEYSSLFYELEGIDNSFLNQYILNWLGKNHPKVEELKESLTTDFKYMLAATANENCSFADVVSALNLLNGTILTDRSINKFTYYLKIYYSIRYNINYNKGKQNYYELTTITLTNNLLFFTPSQRGGRDREIFQIQDFNYLLEKLKNKEISVEVYYWVSFFITHLGERSFRYRNNSKAFYNIPINNVGSQYKEATFNWFSFFVTSLAPEKVLERLLPLDFWDVENELYENIIYWNNNLDKHYYQLFNVMFFEELISIWKEYNFNYKESLGETYEDAMSIYFSESAIKNVFDTLNKKYPYLNISYEIVFNHPILKYWREHKEVIKNLLNDIFSNDRKLDVITKIIKPTNRQKEIINNYIINIPRRSNKKSTTTNLINNLVSTNYDATAILSLKKLRKEMNIRKDHDKIVDEIIVFLKSINS